MQLGRKIGAGLCNVAEYRNLYENQKTRSVGLATSSEGKEAERKKVRARIFISKIGTQ